MIRSAVILLAVILAIGAANLIFTAHEVNAVRAAATSTMQLCEAGNEARAQQIGLWEYLIHLSQKPQTAQGHILLAKFQKHLHQVFAPRNCKAPLTPRRHR